MLLFYKNESVITLLIIYILLILIKYNEAVKKIWLSDNYAQNLAYTYLGNAFEDSLSEIDTLQSRYCNNVQRIFLSI